MSRPVINSLGHFFNRITDPLIRKPVQNAIESGMKDMQKQLSMHAKELSNQISLGSSTMAAGSTIGGISSGLLSGGLTLGGIALGELLRNRNEQQREDELVARLVHELKQ